MVLTSLATAVTQLKCWLNGSSASCAHRQSLAVKHAQVRVTQPLTIRVPKGAHALLHNVEYG